MLTIRDNPAATCQRPGTGRQPGPVALTGRFGATHRAPNRLVHPGLGNPLVLADTRGLIRLAEGVHGLPVAAHRMRSLGEVHPPRGVHPEEPTVNLSALPTVVDALAGQAGIDAARIEPDKPLSAIPEVESIKLLLAFTVIEEAYAVLIPDDFLFGKPTVRELATLVSELAKG